VTLWWLRRCCVTNYWRRRRRRGRHQGHSTRHIQPYTWWCRAHCDLPLTLTSLSPASITQPRCWKISQSCGCILSHFIIMSLLWLPNANVPFMLLRPFALMVLVAVLCGTSLVPLWSHNFSMPALHGGDILKPMKETDYSQSYKRNRTDYNLRKCTHNLTLPTDGNPVMKQNFVCRLVFKDIYWLIFFTNVQCYFYYTLLLRDIYCILTSASIHLYRVRLSYVIEGLTYLLTLEWTQTSLYNSWQ